MTPETILHFIGGKQVPSANGATFGVADPVSNKVYAQAAAGSHEDVDRAVEAATAAFTDGPWPGLAARARSKVLNKIADAIESRADEVASLETFDTGLPITQAKGQAARAAENFRFFADVIVAQHEAAFSSPGQLGYVLRRPAGVAGLITPWNTPFMLATWKLAPALASGCTVVLKPAEWTPLSASLLPEIMTDAGLPGGAFNLVHGIGEAAGAALVAHPSVPRISFTGETSTGRTIMAAAAPHLKGLSMELGGKSPCVIFVEAGLDEGARLVAGGSRPSTQPAGNYLAATVFADVEPWMRIFREEIFGPVVCVTPFDGEADAVALANDTSYGLAAYLWTSDLARAHRLADAVEAGMTWINSHNVRDLRTPFGGVKASGLGREGGAHSLDFYTESRIVHIPLGDTAVPRFGA